MRLFALIGPLALVVLGGCAQPVVRDTTSRIAGSLGLASDHAFVRSSRWTLDPSARIRVHADFGDADEQTAGWLRAAADGVAAVFPRTEPDELPISRADLHERLTAGAGVEVHLHLVFSTEGGTVTAGVGVLDGDSGVTIDQGRVVITAPVYGGNPSEADVRAAFARYAETFVARS